MPLPNLIASPFHSSALLAGRPLCDHLLDILARAGAKPDSTDAYELTLDATYCTISLETLSALIETQKRTGGTLRTADGQRVATIHPRNATASEPGEALRLPPDESLRVCDVRSLAKAEKVLILRRLHKLADLGVHIVDPERVWISHDVSIESGAIIWPDVVLRGHTVIGRETEVQSGCWLENTHVGAEALIKPHTVCDGARIGDQCTIGPMAHLRPGTVLMQASKVGNFVETKKTTLGAGSKASHLTYLGDTVVGEGANIGAGTITCNYDGFGKHPTQIGAGAIIGAGSTIAQDIPADALAVERGETRVLAGKAPVLSRRNKAKADAKKRKASDD